MANSIVSTVLAKIKRRLDYNSGVDADLDAVLLDFLSDNSKILKQWLVDRGLRFETSASVTIKTTKDQNYVSLYETPIAPTLNTITAAGNLDGVYYYKVTYVNAYGESLASNTSLAVTNVLAATGQNNVNVPISRISDTTARNIYRTIGGGTSFLLCAQISNNTPTITEVPANAPTATLVAGLGLITAGAHSYKVTCITADGESDLSAASNSVTTILATFGQVQLSNIPIGTTVGVTDRRVYRTKAGGSVYYLIGSVGDNTTTTFTDNVADASLTLEAMPLSSIYVDNIADGSLTTAEPSTDDRPSYSNIFKVTDRVNKKQVPIIPFDTFMGRYPDPTQIKSTMPDECAISGTRLYIGPTPSSDQLLYVEYDFVFPEITSTSSALFNDSQYDPLLIKMCVEDFYRRYYPKDRARIQTAFEDVIKTKDTLISGAKLTGVTQQSQSRRDQDVLIEPRLPGSVIYP
jgi:hypothetical protein